MTNENNKNPASIVDINDLKQKVKNGELRDCNESFHGIAKLKPITNQSPSTPVTDNQNNKKD